ncbi:MAG: alkaline phosphatase [Flavobacteriaceae bacterium]|nr:alkaline phosphatase [Flavobacteriaceae bacterium]
MMVRSLLLSLICSFIIAIGWSQEKASSVEYKGKKPKNIILLIGDGMGLSQISLAQFYGDGDSNFERFQHIGLLKNSADDKLVTDSAASATSYATGEKTYNGAIGLKRDSIYVPNIVENVSQNGWSTGIIATSSITHATPASFYAHAKSRHMHEAIATALVTSDIDFFAGGGLKYFNKRLDERDLLLELKLNGFAIDTLTLPLATRKGKVGMLLADDGLPKMIEGRGNFLAKATSLGLNHLGQNKKGFFLMVEGSQIDWAGHSNEVEYLIAEQLDFDETVGIALDYAEKHGETLVIVTADHETGGFTLAAKSGDYDTIEPSFSTYNHSATMIPIFAKGPGASLFNGVYENTEVYHKLMSLLRKN